MKQPSKTREMHNFMMNSTHWNDFPFREGDVVIGTWSKTGTTWVQQIIAQLIFGGSEVPNVHAMSPWVELRVMPLEEKLELLEGQTHRRFMKTHLPVDAMVFDERARYIYVARDGRDVAWSMHNHHYRFTDEFYAMVNETPGLVGPKVERPTADVEAYYRDWLAKDGAPWWSFFDHVKSWWSVRELDNVLLVHFADLKANLAAEIRRIADFLGYGDADLPWEQIEQHCGFDYMKRNASQVAPLGGVLWEGGAQTFIHRGTNGRWRDVLSDQDIAEYQAVAEARLGADCARWLELGSRA